MGIVPATPTTRIAQGRRSINASEHELIDCPAPESTNNEIVVEIDRATFNNQDFQILQQLPSIIKDSGEIGEFELSNLKIKITQMNEYQNNLIKVQ